MLKNLGLLPRGDLLLGIRARRVGFMHIIESLRENAIADVDLLRKNDSMGDVFAKPRDVDFAFKTNDGKQAEILCAFIKEMNYGSARVEIVDKGLFRVINVIHMPINQHIVCSVSGFMHCIGELFHVEFDGWGSVIQNE
jgi:hypothetical protein